MAARPNFFILGAPKCGTTSLTRWLEEHPSLYFSKPREPKFFATDIPHRRFIDTLDKYEALFAEAGPEHRAIGEKSTEYLYSQAAVPNILNYQPDAKLIALLRNPVTLAPSLHEQMIYDGDESILDFAQAWQAQFPVRDPQTIPAGPYHPAFYQYADRCMLGAQVQRLLQRAPAERVLLVFSEDLRDRPAQTYREVLNFLNLEDDGRTDFSSVNSAKMLRHPWMSQVSNRVFALKSRLGLNVRTGMLRKLRRWNKVERARPPMSDVLRAELEDHFREDIRLLQELSGRDLSHWIKGPAKA